MGRLGVSIYPERSTLEEEKAYLDLAQQSGFQRVFTSVLELTDDKEKLFSSCSEIIAYANSLGMEVTTDINAQLLKQLAISVADLVFFKQLGVKTLRLDDGFSGAEVAQLTHNSLGIKIEINMSAGLDYVEDVFAYEPNAANLAGSHNFYPHRYTGLSYDYFTACSKKYRELQLNTTAFVNSPAATFGPWPTQDGLCSLEEHRELELTTQVKHFRLTGLIDDLIIGNAYASESDLQTMSQAFFAEYPELKLTLNEEITEDELLCLFDNVHTYRQDHSAYLVRSTITRKKYHDQPFPPHNTQDMVKGDVLIDNVGYGQYKGETQIALQPMKNDGRVNVVGRLTAEELFLLDYLKPLTEFKMIEE